MVDSFDLNSVELLSNNLGNYRICQGGRHRAVLGRESRINFKLSVWADAVFYAELGNDHIFVFGHPEACKIGYEIWILRFLNPNRIKLQYFAFSSATTSHRKMIADLHTIQAQGT